MIYLATIRRIPLPVAVCLAVAVACIAIQRMIYSQPSRHKISDTVPLSHVRGSVLVDEVPTPGIHIQYVPLHEIAERRERYRNRFFMLTRTGGRFSLSTYVDGDGLPYGDYALEFRWIEQNLSGERDRFGGRYSKPPFKTIKVEAGKELDLGEIKLSTKPDARAG